MKPPGDEDILVTCDIEEDFSYKILFE